MTIKCVSEGEPKRLPLRLADCFFRIGQEAISNAVLHSGSSSLSIILRHDAKRLTLLITDDGRGLMERQESTGNGLFGMSKRAEMVGAHLDISSDAHGTTGLLESEVAGLPHIFIRSAIHDLWIYLREFIRRPAHERGTKCQALDRRRSSRGSRRTAEHDLKPSANSSCRGMFFGGRGTARSASATDSRDADRFTHVSHGGYRAAALVEAEGSGLQRSNSIDILSTYELDEEVFQAFEAGAWGYLSKDALPNHISSSIELVHAGKLIFSVQMMELIEQRRQRKGLTARELSVLEMVAKGLTNKEIAGASGVSQFTVRNQLSNISAKLDVSDRTEAARVALEQGIIRID